MKRKDESNINIFEKTFKKVKIDKEMSIQQK